MVYNPLFVDPEVDHYYVITPGHFSTEGANMRVRTVLAQALPPADPSTLFSTRQCSVAHRDQFTLLNEGGIKAFLCRGMLIYVSDVSYDEQ